MRAGRGVKHRVEGSQFGNGGMLFPHFLVTSPAPDPSSSLHFIPLIKESQKFIEVRSTRYIDRNIADKGPKVNDCTGTLVQVPGTVIWSVQVPGANLTPTLPFHRFVFPCHLSFPSRDSFLPYFYLPTASPPCPVLLPSLSLPHFEVRPALGA